MKPIIKYRGGKSKEIKYFEKYIPKEYNTYIEPFFGGGAVFFYLEPKKSIINDINKPLMSYYKELSLNYQEIKNELKNLEEIYAINRKDFENLKFENPNNRVEDKNEKIYYYIRNMYNNKIEKKYNDASIYYFINKTAYSGLIRYNANGEFNVPFGRYKNFNTDLITEKHSELLKQAQIVCGDYEKIFKSAKEDDFMFLDPPYDCVFSDYGNEETKNGFLENEHKRLAQNFYELKCKAMMVIGKTELTENLYKDYIIGEYEKDYSVNIRNRFKSKATHIIVVNYKLEGNVNG